MKNIIIVIFMLCGISVFLVSSCRNNKKKEQEVIVDQISREDKMAGRLINKKMTSFNKIISEKDKENRLVISHYEYIYH
jgi:hypothetical protein